MEGFPGSPRKGQGESQGLRKGGKGFRGPQAPLPLFSGHLAFPLAFPGLPGSPSHCLMEVCCKGISAREGQPGKPRNVQEGPGRPREAQEGAGRPMEGLAGPGKPREAQEGPERAWKAQGGLGRSREFVGLPGSPWESQRVPGSPWESLGLHGTFCDSLGLPSLGPGRRRKAQESLGRGPGRPVRQEDIPGS